MIERKTAATGKPQALTGHLKPGAASQSASHQDKSIDHNCKTTFHLGSASELVLKNHPY
jgi:hypothetical protein